MIFFEKTLWHVKKTLQKQWWSWWELCTLVGLQPIAECVSTYVKPREVYVAIPWVLPKVSSLPDMTQRLFIDHATILWRLSWRTVLMIPTSRNMPCSCNSRGPAPGQVISVIPKICAFRCRNQHSQSNIDKSQWRPERNIKNGDH